jgi:Skp family chaperone for outer membrane proteins
MNTDNLYGSGETSDDVARKAIMGKSIDKPKKAAPTPASKKVARYFREIERYHRSTEAWTQEGKNIEKLYLEEDRTEGTATRRYALLWANVETLKPAVYAKLPTVECSRRYKDRDPIARVAAELMERCVNTTFEIYDVDETFQLVRDDRLLPGRGQGWVRYEANIEKYPVETETGAQAVETETEEEFGERVKGERVCVDYVHWQDFGHNVAGTWNDVWLGWRWVYKNKDEVTERFGQQIANEVSYNAKAPAMVRDAGDGSSQLEQGEEFCKIAEVWDKRARMVTWITEGRDEPLDSGEPPIDFGGFFPFPRPCYATKTSRKLVPRADYIYYRDQAKEINDLTDKIGNMCDWLIVKAFVPSGPSKIADAIEEVVRENSNRELFVQVDSMQEWTERGGAKGLIDWLPLDMIIQAINSAIAARNVLIQDVFQITGISDILRGQTDPSETLGAQELKAQTGSRRLRNTKDEVARFCRDVSRLAAEVVAEKFSPETIAELSGYRYQPVPAPAPVSMLPPGTPLLPLAAPMGGQVPPAGPEAPGDAQGGPDMVFDDRVIELLRNDRLRTFRIDIETDSTAQADENAEKERRVEFLTSVGGFIDKSAQAIERAPELAPMLGEMVGFAVRGFRAGRGLEEQVERTFANIVKKVQAPVPNQPSPEQIKAQADAERARQEMTEAAQKHQQDMERGQQEAANKQAEHQMRMAELDAEYRNTQQAHNLRMVELVAKTVPLQPREVPANGAL